MPVFSKLTNASVRMDLEASFDYLEKQMSIKTPNVAVMGFCMGGLAAMISACAHPIGTAIAYYGGGMVESRPGIGFSPIIQDFGKIQCPVLLIFGEEDQSIPAEQRHAVEAALKAHHKKFEMVVYPGAGHGFSNDDRPSFKPEATQAAWKKTLAWLSGL
jgi:carboxymethylenebutenolidase